MTAPDPMKGVRGVFAAICVLEAIVVLLGLLVLAKADGASALGTAVISGAGLLHVVASGVQRKRWGLGFALVLQVVVLATGFVVPAMFWIGGVFVLVWAGVLLLRRDVARKMARGELPSQQR